MIWLMHTFVLSPPERAICVGASLRNAKASSGGVAFPERLGALAVERHHEQGVGVWQRHHEERHLPKHPRHVRQRVAEVHLRLARRVHQRHEHLAPALPQLPHRVLHGRVAALKSLRLKHLPDPLGRVTLLPRHLFVGLQDRLDLVQVRTDLARRRRLRPAVARRLRVRQNLLKRLPVHPRLTQHLTLAHPLDQDPVTDV
jgi:hypothetical protein